MKIKYGDVLVVSVYVQRRGVDNGSCVCLLYLDQSAIMAAGRVERERTACDFFMIIS